MLTLLSPAKSLDYESPIPIKRSTEPQFLDRSEELVSVMAAKSPDEIGDLMSISDDLAMLNWQRFQDWDRSLPKSTARQAVLAFRGDTYVGLDVSRWDGRDFAYAQNHLRILSGLHGVLRPLDRIAPYRLEMGTKLRTNHGRNLYEYWGGTITETLADDLEGRRPRALLNCASQEYFKAVKPERLDATVITPRFLDYSSGEYRVISFFAKRARGALASWTVRNRVNTIRAIPEFDELGYRFDPTTSTRTAPVFLRHP